MESKTKKKSIPFKKFGGMKKWDGLQTFGGLKKFGGMKRSRMKNFKGMKEFRGMTSFEGMKLFQSSMKLFEVYKAPNPERELQGAVAAAGSALLAVGGIALMILTAGTATPAIGAAGTSLAGTLGPAVGMAVVGTGVSSSAGAIISTVNGDFEMLDWAKDFSINAGTSIITLGAGFGAGSITGIALTSKTFLSGSAIKAIASAAGGLSGTPD